MEIARLFDKDGIPGPLTKKIYNKVAEGYLTKTSEYEGGRQNGLDSRGLLVVSRAA